MRLTRERKTRIGAFELTKRGVARWDWRDPYHLLVGLGWVQFVAAFLLAELALNALFAALYLAVPGCIANMAPGSVLLAFSFSLETLATVGYGVMSPETAYGHIVSMIEIVTGVLFTALVTGLIFVRFARPRANVIAARTLVVAEHEGYPTLMARIGNARLAPLLDAHVRLSALMTRRMRDGQVYRGAVELPLLRPRIPTFALTWTVMHRIDSASPFHGMSPEQVREHTIRIYAIVQAHDPVLAAGIHVMRDWDVADILFGMRYADAVTNDEQGHIIVDLGLISDVEPDEQPLDVEMDDAAELPEIAV